MSFLLESGFLSGCLIPGSMWSSWRDGVSLVRSIVDLAILELMRRNKAAGYLKESKHNHFYKAHLPTKSISWQNRFPYWFSLPWGLCIALSDLLHWRQLVGPRSGAWLLASQRTGAILVASQHDLSPETTGSVSCQFLHWALGVFHLAWNVVLSLLFRTQLSLWMEGRHWGVWRTSSNMLSEKKSIYMA